MRPDPHSRAGLVQQTVQIVASLRSNDLTLFVGLNLYRQYSEEALHSAWWNAGMLAFLRTAAALG